MDPKDEFYLPEEVVEWIGQKKSEYLSQIIEAITPDDFGFEEFHRFNDEVPQTIGEPERAFQFVDDQYPMKTFVRSYSNPEFHQQVVVGVVLPEKNSKEEIFVPILVFVTRKEDLIRLFSRGETVKKPVLN